MLKYFFKVRMLSLSIQVIEYIIRFVWKIWFL